MVISGDTCDGSPPGCPVWKELLSGYRRCEELSVKSILTMEQNFYAFSPVRPALQPIRETARNLGMTLLSV